MANDELMRLADEWANAAADIREAGSDPVSNRVARTFEKCAALLREVAALEPVAYDILSDGCHMRVVTPSVKNNWLEAFKRSSAVPLYTLTGATHD